MATINEIKQQAAAVKNATQVAENTAVRVGGVLVDLANKAKELEDNIATKADTSTVNTSLANVKSIISTEVQERKQAIAAEAKAREAADAAEVQARQAAIASEEQARIEGLAKKADSADVESKFAEESERVDSELAKKANAKDVEQSFSEQISKNAEQDAEIAKKANAEEVNSYLNELQNTVFPLQVSLSLDKTLLEFTGNNQSIKVTYTVKRKGEEVTPTALGLSVNGTMQSVDLKPSGTVTVNVNKEGESTIVLTAKYSDLIKSVSAKVTMVLPIYCGFGTSETDVAIAGNKLGPRTSASGTYTKTSAKDNVNFIILVPKTLPGLSSFSMGGAPFVMVTSSVVINGKDYYMYKSGGVYMSGTTVKVQAS